MAHARHFPQDSASTLVKSLLSTFEKEDASADRDKLIWTMGFRNDGITTIASAITHAEQKLNAARKSLEDWTKVANNPDELTGVRHDFDKNEISYEIPVDLIDRQLIGLNIQINRLSEIVSQLKAGYYLLTSSPSKEDIAQYAAKVYQFLYQSCCDLDNKEEEARRVSCLKEFSQLPYAHEVFTECQRKIDENIHAHMFQDHYAHSEAFHSLMLLEGLRYYMMADAVKAAMPAPRAQINDPTPQCSNRM